MRRNLSIVALVAAAGLLLMTLAARSSSNGRFKAAALPETGLLKIEAVGEVVVGEDLQFKIIGADLEQPVVLTVGTGYETRTISETGSDTMTVPYFDGPASGTLLITATQKQRLGTATFNLRPTDPVDPIDVFLGPRTVVADNEHVVMEVAVPTDEFGNPVQAGTSVDFQVLRADQTSETFQAETSGLLASWVIGSHTVAGRSRISAKSGTTGAAERTFLEVAGTPAPYEISLIDPLVAADGNTLVRIQTDLLRDAFGNQLPDGTAVTLDTTGATGTRRLSSQTVDGKATFSVEVPALPGSVTLAANASGVASQPLTLLFPPAVQDITAIGSQETATVSIGPVFMDRESYVPDGTIALLTSADGTTIEVPLLLGVGTADIPTDADISRMTVEVLGTKSFVENQP